MTPAAFTTIKIAASALLIVGSLTYMLSTSMSEEMEFFHPADVVIVKADELRGQRMRMGGHVMKGSVAQKPGTLEYQFAVQPIAGMLKHPEAADKYVTVRFTGIVPDTFKDDAQVIVTGTLGDDNVFAAKDLIAKCPSKYEAQAKNDGTY
mgnify:CR=1 FL=1